MKVLLVIGLSWLLAGCTTTYTRADGTVCKRYEPSCGLLGDSRLVCELDENGCEICTCAPGDHGDRGRPDHESGRNGYWEPER